MSNPRKDTRLAFTIKGAAFDSEFRSLINKAAERQGLSQADWCLEILRREAQRVLKGNPAESPPEPIQLPALPAEKLEERFGAIEAQLREIMERMAPQPALPPATRWQRAWAALTAA